MSDQRDLGPSRRRILAAMGTIGAAGALGGAATTSLLWDEEKFGTANNPNVLQAGAVDLAVDWEVRYYDWIDSTPQIQAEQDLVKESAGPNSPNDQPGPIIELTDVKPGDVLEMTLSAHVFGNPAFLSARYEELSDTDNGITEPEDKVNGHTPDQSDGTDDGDLDDHMQVVVWYDDGDNLPNELMGVPQNTEDYVMDIAAIQDAAAEFGDDEDVLFAGTMEDLDAVDDVQLNASKSSSTDTNTPSDGTDTDDDLVAEEFSEFCYEASATEYIGVLAWLPRDIADVNDNIVQTDRLEFTFGFDAVQCRHNVAPGTGGPVDGGDNGVGGQNGGVVVDGEKAISWVSICCGEGNDPAPVADYVDCVTLDGDGEVDEVGLSGLNTNMCDVYFKTGDGIFMANDGMYEPPAEVTNSDYCGQPTQGGSDDDTVGLKMDGEDIVALKENEDLPDCPDEA